VLLATVFFRCGATYIILGRRAAPSKRLSLDLMTQQDTDATLARTRIDGGFSFALAAFAIGLGLLAVLERVGLPDMALKASVGALVFCEFVVIAALLRTMRPVDFYVGGRALPPPYAGLAYAGLAAGLFLPFLPPLPHGVGLNSLIAGFCAGLFCAVFLTGPYLRRCGAASIADLVGSRFSNPVARIVIAGITATCAGLVAIGGYEIALRALLTATGASRPFGVVVLGLLLVLLIVPGGLSGVIWLASGAAVVALAALGLPQALPILRETIPSAALARFDTLSGAQQNLPIEPAIVAALALGLGALAPLFGPAVASRDRGLRSGFFATFFIGIIAVLAALTVVHSTLALDSALVGHGPGQLPPEILAASAQGAVSICGIQSASSAAIAGTCASETDFSGVLRQQDITADARYLLEDLPVLRHSGPMLAGLAAVFAIALGVAVAAAGVQSFATSLGHDVFHPQRRRYGPASRRLAFARALALLLIGFCAAALGNGADADPRPFIGLALTISATLLAPLVGLTLVRRATSMGALVAMLVAALVMSTFVYTHGWTWPPEELASNVIFAALDGILAGILVSFLLRQDFLAAPPALPAPKEEPFGPD
jgi:cation/acetate symporter